ARGRAGQRAAGGAAQALCVAPGTAAGDRGVAGALPQVVGRPADRPGTPPRHDGGLMDEGTLTMIDGRPVLRFERRLRHPVATVWRAITDPAELAGWFPWQVEID